MRDEGVMIGIFSTIGWFAINSWLVDWSLYEIVCFRSRLQFQFRFCWFNRLFGWLVDYLVGRLVGLLVVLLRWDGILLILIHVSIPILLVKLEQGGSADEGVMIGILSTIAPPFDMDQIKSQALWSATQAVLIINEHKVRPFFMRFYFYFCVFG